MWKFAFFSIGMFLVSVLSVLADESPVDALLSADSANVQEENLPSPNFVDGVRCIGLNPKTLSESWLIAKEEVEITQKIEDQEDCEDLLRAFGIDKHKWLNPEDLESASTRLKQSGYFEEVDLSIKKSE